MLHLRSCIFVLLGLLLHDVVSQTGDLKNYTVCESGTSFLVNNNTVAQDYFPTLGIFGGLLSILAEEEIPGTGAHWLTYWRCTTQNCSSGITLAPRRLTNASSVVTASYLGVGPFGKPMITYYDLISGSAPCLSAILCHNFECTSRTTRKCLDACDIGQNGCGARSAFVMFPDNTAMIGHAQNVSSSAREVTARFVKCSDPLCSSISVVWTRPTPFINLQPANAGERIGDGVMVSATQAFFAVNDQQVRGFLCSSSSCIETSTPFGVPSAATYGPNANAIPLYDSVSDKPFVFGSSGIEILHSICTNPLSINPSCSATTTMTTPAFITSRDVHYLAIDYNPDPLTPFPVISFIQSDGASGSGPMIPKLKIFECFDGACLTGQFTRNLLGGIEDAIVRLGNAGGQYQWSGRSTGGLAMKFVAPGWPVFAYIGTRSGDPLTPPSPASGFDPDQDGVLRLFVCAPPARAFLTPSQTPTSSSSASASSTPSKSPSVCPTPSTSPSPCRSASVPSQSTSRSRSASISNTRTVCPSSASTLSASISLSASPTPQGCRGTAPFCAASAVCVQAASGVLTWQVVNCSMAGATINLDDPTVVSGDISLPDGSIVNVATNASLFVNGTLTLGDGTIVRVTVTERGVTVIPLFFATNGINGTVLIEPNTDSLELTDCEEVTAASVNDGTQLSAVITTDSSSCNAAGHDDDQTALIVGIVVPIVCVCCCCVFILLVVALATALLPRSHRLFDATSDQDGSEVARRDSVGWEETTRGVETGRERSIGDGDSVGSRQSRRLSARDVGGIHGRKVSTASPKPCVEPSDASDF